MLIVDFHRSLGDRCGDFIVSHRGKSGHCRETCLMKNEGYWSSHPSRRKVQQRVNRHLLREVVRVKG